MPGGFEIPITIRLDPRERFEITAYCASRIRKLAKGLPPEARRKADEDELEFYIHLYDKVTLGNQLAGSEKLRRKREAKEAAKQL